jgi:cyclophilin family peptidyl-prolyl cis-trans isomerase
MKNKSLSAALVLFLLTLAGCGGGSAPDAGPLAAKQLALISSSATTATFSGARSAYTVTRSGAGFAVRENANGVISILAGGVQTLIFDDVSVNLNMGESSLSIPAADLKLLVELYLAFFGRVPEADGLRYWIIERSKGTPLDTIAESFYAAAITPTNSPLTGYSASMSNADFVAVIYRNVLGRSSVDAGGMAYWTGSLASGAETRGSLVRTILNSAHTFKGDPSLGYVADLLDNKFTVGNYFAVQNGLNYLSTETSYTRTVAIAARVTPSDTSAAISSIGISDSAFNLPALVTNVSLVSSGTLMYRKQATLTVTGQNLDAAISIVAPTCSGLNELAGATATTRSFTCTPTAVGPMQVQILRARDGAALLTVAPVVPAPRVTMKTNMGDMLIELYPTNAPITVDNFLQYVNDGFYAGSIFHRVISNFVIQGGGFNTQLAALPTRAPIKLEAPNGLSNQIYTVAMARTSVRDSATSQFFINVSTANGFLDASSTSDGYAVFGKVVGGTAVADAIKAVPVVNYGSFASIPYTFVIISSVTQTQ